MGLNATVAAHKSAVTAFTSACHMSMAAAGHALRTSKGSRQRACSSRAAGPFLKARNAAPQAKRSSILTAGEPPAPQAPPSAGRSSSEALFSR